MMPPRPVLVMIWTALALVLRVSFPGSPVTPWVVGAYLVVAPGFSLVVAFGFGPGFDRVVTASAYSLSTLI